MCSMFSLSGSACNIRLVCTPLRYDYVELFQKIEESDRLLY